MNVFSSTNEMSISTLPILSKVFMNETLILSIIFYVLSCECYYF